MPPGVHVDRSSRATSSHGKNSLGRATLDHRRRPRPGGFASIGFPSKSPSRHSAIRKLKSNSRQGSDSDQSEHAGGLLWAVEELDTCYVVVGCCGNQQFTSTLI